MEIVTFLLHFFYIAVTFMAGVVIGYRFKENISVVLSKIFR